MLEERYGFFFFFSFFLLLIFFTRAFGCYSSCSLNWMQLIFIIFFSLLKCSLGALAGDNMCTHRASFFSCHCYYSYKLGARSKIPFFCVLLLHFPFPFPFPSLFIIPLTVKSYLNLYSSCSFFQICSFDLGKEGYWKSIWWSNSSGYSIMKLLVSCTKKCWKHLMAGSTCSWLTISTDNFLSSLAFSCGCMLCLTEIYLTRITIILPLVLYQIHLCLWMYRNKMAWKCARIEWLSRRYVRH